MRILNAAVIIVLLVQGSLNLDYQRHLQCEHVLNYIIRLVKEKRLGEFHDEGLKKCAESKCCQCGLQFKNSTFANIHIGLHHHLVLNYSEEVVILFDDSVPTQQKYEFCHQFLAGFELRAEDREDVCIIISEGYYKPKMFIVVMKYIMFVVVVLLMLIYYSDIANASKR